MPKFKDLIGQKFGRLTVTEHIKGDYIDNKRINKKCKCICDCGNEYIVRRDRLVSGYTKSCGCLRNECRNYKDITGYVFGKLVAISFERINNKTMWLCQCGCGNKVKIELSTLQRHKIDCGCGFTERSTQFSFKHGLTNTPEYYAYNGMKCRCLDINNSNYGGRGITVCDRWLDSFENFYSDMGARPTKSHSLDRIDVNGNYEPSNCRWATAKEQANNRTNNKYIEYKGCKKTHAEWATFLGIPPQLIYHRVKLGMPLDKVLSITDGRYKKTFNLNK